jgi:hypothetical protein
MAAALIFTLTSNSEHELRPIRCDSDGLVLGVDNRQEEIDLGP